MFHSDLPDIAANTILGDTLFVTLACDVAGLDIHTGNTVWLATVGGCSLGRFDGITADTSGYLYVIRTTGSIIRINIADKTWTTFVTGLTPGVQDVIFDKRHNRLLVCTFAINHPIQAVSLPDGEVSVAISPAPGSFDGITIDDIGGVYASTFASGGQVLRWDSTFANPPVVIAAGVGQPTGLDYNWRDGILAVPIFDRDTVLFFDVKTPIIDLLSFTLSDSQGNGDGHLEPGETGEVVLNLRNNGGDAASVSAELSAVDPHVTLEGSSLVFGTIAGWGQEIPTSMPCTVTIDSACPDPHVAVLEVNITADDYSSMDTILLFAGNQPGFEDDMDGSPAHWTDLSTTGTSQWHLDDYRSHSGEYSRKMGGPGPTNYSNGQDAKLVTPPFFLGRKAELSFWHYIDAEDDTAQGMAWDGGVVMISTGDNGWEQLIPEGGYPYSTMSNPASPFEAGTPCFSGNHDWEQVHVDLSSYSGVVQIMFRFGSDMAETREGWYIDDVVIVGDPITCCNNVTGNVDGDPGEVIDIGDLTALIGFLFIPPNTPPVCMEEANINGDEGGEVDIGDLTALIGYLFIPPNPEVAEC
ncbi:MAG: choice-of-anchor J domain-containing protein [Candidatus Zixiibacteriota bacterium]|nr:MAG: choice-of-anchor J domain-containing protein [candidate division Zixibacteria bacterium]